MRDVAGLSVSELRLRMKLLRRSGRWLIPAFVCSLVGVYGEITNNEALDWLVVAGVLMLARAEYWRGWLSGQEAADLGGDHA